MNAAVVPFPTARRTRFIRDLAARALDMTAPNAERHIARQLRLQREKLERKGIPHDRIESEIARAERAIRQEMARLTFSSGGVA